MRTCPWVDDVVDVATTSAEWAGEPQRCRELLRFVRRVWPLDLEVLLQPGTLYRYVPSRALSWFSGAPVRWCWEDPTAGIDTGSGFHTRTLAYPNGWHETEKCFQMLSAMGLKPEGRPLETWWNAQDARQGDVLAREARRGRRRLIALGLAAGEPAKRWPHERYLEIIRAVTDREDASFLALGGSDVKASCNWLLERAPSRVTYPSENLGVAWAALSQCDLYIGNDCGLMHMAAAARVPVVAVIGLPEGAPSGTRGHPSHTGPHDTLSRIVRPAKVSGYKLNAAAVSTEAVARATWELLRETTRS
jgi:ADP-heptose:LPS heptosyltransferase